MLCEPTLVCLFQALALTMDFKNVSQYSIYVHQHKDVYPECSEPYGLHGLKVVAHDKKGIMEKRKFLIKDTLFEGLPRKKLPCHIHENIEELGYDGGIGECIDGKHSVKMVTLAFTNDTD